MALLVTALGEVPVRGTAELQETTHHEIEV